MITYNDDDFVYYTNRKRNILFAVSEFSMPVLSVQSITKVYARYQR